ncbi:PREDICTED: protein LNK4-like isoform X2 [Camelina sativa]|uniref:Protein LNK4-like isoform X2 n=1 Tax=Camelina sativa TaxID=90675 RepID=A0ABM0XUQ8_CAMSA|nr:PREDICTED: protein LNK4-like isoform X2 [Camelina sativa]
MDRYSRRNLEDLVVPNYQETSDSYPSPDMWGTTTTGWNMNSSAAVAEKCFDYDVINNGFSGGLYSQMEMGTCEQVEEETKRLKASGCFDRSLHDFDEIQQMDDMFFSILEDVPGNGNFHSFKESDNSNTTTSSSAYLDNTDGREVPMFHYNWETCQDMPLMEEAPMNLCEENMEEASAEEVVLQDLQRATEKLTDDTRKCFRDTFYRLAKNSQQKSDSNLEEFFEDRTSSNTAELETNSMDRAIANLTFNKMESNMRNMPPPKRLSSIQG